jgi:hypothetical protein
VHTSEREKVGEIMQTLSNLVGRWGGLALMFGALMFSLTKARGYVDPDDSLLLYFMLVGFAAWLVGLAALYVRYASLSGKLGKAGLGMTFAGMVLLTVGHIFTFLFPFLYLTTGTDLFLLVVVGVLALILGPFLFGIAALRMDVLPRRWRFLPLVTALIGIVWIFNSSDDGSLTFGFMFFRTLFALGWLLMGYVLWAYRDGPLRQTATAT